MDKKIILVGGFHQIIELCEAENIEIVGIIDDNIEADCYLSYPILGKDCDAKHLFQKYGNIPLLLTPEQPLVKAKLFNLYSKLGFTFTNLISKEAKISPSAMIADDGVIIYPGARVSSGAIIENFVRLHSGASVDHDTVVKKFSNIAPFAVILGRIIINELVYIGANSTILPNINIGINSIVGAGAVVTKDIGENQVWVGNPAHSLKIHNADIDIQFLNLL